MLDVKPLCREGFIWYSGSFLEKIMNYVLHVIIFKGKIKKGKNSVVPYVDCSQCRQECLIVFRAKQNLNF